MPPLSRSETIGLDSCSSHQHLQQERENQTYSPIAQSVRLSASSVVTPHRADSKGSEQVDGKKDPKARKVSFSNTVKLRKIPRRQDMSPQQIADIWIDKHELKAMRKSCRQTVRRLEKVGGDEALRQQIAEHGLERQLSEHMLRRQINRIVTCHEVLCMQDFQLDLCVMYKENNNVSSFIAARYAMFSEESRNEALRRAQEDAAACTATR